ncbi:Tetratricopeptide repeat superfamily protein [Perilla frutescens var. hirtella]|uniref:Tetratricopeptide repeat superfamily protein n=1 Tax=Perilla frutescens var. hirtella TaxID=608512 RepID=A0AAD4JPQ1_PERFH|nr:Tetratricopeptide repeat superfamily protein [Perilla frutescens var. hirtella]
MEAVAEGLWALAEQHEQRLEIREAVKCLEAICQSPVSFLPIVEIKTRLRVAALLLKHSHNVNHAKSHLERSQLLLKSIPSCFELKCRAYSLLSQCYHLVGAIPSQKQMLNKGLELASVSGEGFAGKLWSCNFNSQLANALIIEGDYLGSVLALQQGLTIAVEMYYLELQMFFATSILHVRVMQWDSTSLVEESVNQCNLIWESLEPEKKQHCLGLLFYHELLQLFYLLRICDYKTAAERIDKLDAAMKSDLQRIQHIRDLTNELDALNQTLSRTDLNYKDRSALAEKQTKLDEQIKNYRGETSTGKTPLEPAYFGNVKRAWAEKLELAPPPIDGEWLPKSAVYALVDLMVVVFNRPKGVFKECQKRIESGLQIIQEELVQLGVTEGITEVELQHSAIWMAGVYLMLLMQFLENKVAIDLTRSEFVEAQEALVQMKNWFVRFPTILQACESTVEMLRGQYAHSVGYYGEAAFHFLEASKLTQSKSLQAMSHIYAAVSFICIGDAESSSKAVDLIGPVLGVIDSFVGVREKTTALYTYGFLLMRQQNLQEARIRLASGLQTTHTYLGNLQLVSQYLTVLGNLALSLHDTGQAREILRSALTLARKLNDIPTQNWVLSNMTALYQQTGERGSEMENVAYQRRKAEDLQQRLTAARSTVHHNELIAKVKLQVHQLNEHDMKRAIAGPSKTVDLDIPESVGLLAPQPMPSSARLMDVDIRRLGKRRL